jgi:hypothetical protein
VSDATAERVSLGPPLLGALVDVSSVQQLHPGGHRPALGQAEPDVDAPLELVKTVTASIVRATLLESHESHVGFRPSE